MGVLVAVLTRSALVSRAFGKGSDNDTLVQL